MRASAVLTTGNDRRLRSAVPFHSAPLLFSSRDERSTRGATEKVPIRSRSDHTEPVGAASGAATERAGGERAGPLLTSWIRCCVSCVALLCVISSSRRLCSRRRRCLTACSRGGAQCARCRSERTQRCQCTEEARKRTRRKKGKTGVRRGDGADSRRRLSFSRFLSLCAVASALRQTEAQWRIQGAQCCVLQHVGSRCVRFSPPEAIENCVRLLTLSAVCCDVQCGISTRPSVGAVRVKRRCGKWKPRGC